ncbi:MAG: pyridoxal-phosphate dependent enzyme [Planctomycetes bacterium]|nr:pyridoxal-phosphate dependent enzyme [Planctomycetota bacterium]
MIPTLEEILDARRQLTPHFPPTPLYPNPALSREVGFPVSVKFENHMPTGSFKVRGAFYHLSRLRDRGVAGVATASTGNHGMGVLDAARRLQFPAVVVIPEGTDALKADRLRDLGGEVRTLGRDLREACAHCRELAARAGLAYVEDGEDAGLMVGAATVAAEILEQETRTDAVFVPVGGGNLIAAVCLAVGFLRPDTRVIGVQSEAAPAAFLSWQQRQWVVTDRCETFAGGLATRNPGRFAFSVYGPRISDFVLVSEQALRKAVAGMLRATGFVAEGAAAAPLAACRAYRGRWQCRNACFIFSGGNLAVETLRDILINS